MPKKKKKFAKIYQQIISQTSDGDSGFSLSAATQCVLYLFCILSQIQKCSSVTREDFIATL